KGSGAGRFPGSWSLTPDAHVKRAGAAMADMGVLHARNVGAELRQSQPLRDLALEHAALAELVVHAALAGNHQDEFGATLLRSLQKREQCRISLRLRPA